MEKELFLELGDIAIEALNAAAKTIKTLQIAAGAIYSDDNHNWTAIHDAKIGLDSYLLIVVDGI